MTGMTVVHGLTMPYAHIRALGVHWWLAHALVAGSCAAVALLQEEGLQQWVAEPLRRPEKAAPRPMRLGLWQHPSLGWRIEAAWWLLTSSFGRSFECRH